MLVAARASESVQDYRRPTASRGGVRLFFGGLGGGGPLVEQLVGALDRQAELVADGFQTFAFEFDRVFGRRGRQTQQVAGAGQSGIDVRADISAAQPLDEAGFFHHHQRVSVRRAQDEMLAFALQFLKEIFEGVEAGGVHGHDLAHAQDEDVRLLALAFEDGFELVHRAEKEGPGHAKDHYPFGHLFADERMVGAFSLGAYIHGHDLGGFRGTFDEQDRGEDHADFDRRGEVNDDGQHEGAEEHGGVGSGPLGQAPEVVPFAHVQSDIDEDGAEGGKGNEFGGGGGREDDEQEGEGVDHSGDGGPGAALDVRGGASDGAGGGDAAEERAEDVGQALGHEFLIGVMAVIHHAVGHHGAEERFDGRQDGNGHGWREQMADVFPGERGQMGRGKSLRDAAKAAADGLDVEAEQANNQGPEDESDNRSRDAALERLWPKTNNGERTGSEAEGGPLQRAQVLKEHFHFFDEFGRNLVHTQPEKVFDLGSEDEDGDAAGETHGNRVGDVFDDGAQAREAHDEQEQPGQDGADGEVVEAVFGADTVEDDDEGAGRPADTDFGAAQSRDEEAGNDSGEDARFGFDPRGNGKSHRQWQSDDADGDAGNEVGGEVFGGITLERVEKFGMKGKGQVHIRCSASKRWMASGAAWMSSRNCRSRVSRARPEMRRRYWPESSAGTASRKTSRTERAAPALQGSGSLLRPKANESAFNSGKRA